MIRIPTHLALLGGLLAGTAFAAEWGDFSDAFPVFPCPDGWAACVSDGERVSPDLQQGSGGLLRPADMRIDWSSLEPTGVFSPFARLTVYTGRPPEPEPEPEPEEDIPEPVRDPQPQQVAADDHGSQTPDPVQHDDGMAQADPQPSNSMVRPPDGGSKGDSMVRPPDGGTQGDSMVRPPDGGQQATDDAQADAQMEQQEQQQQEEVTPPEPTGPETCDNLTRLEPAAMMGKLTDGQVACLEASIASAAKQTDKDKISRVLMANAWSRGDKKTWEKLVRRHLDEIDQSDPDICYKYSLYLSRKGPGRAHGVIRWADVALQNKTRWSGDTYKSRVYNLYKLRAAAAQQLWRVADEKHASTPSDDTKEGAEQARNQTKTYAREWYEYAKEAGKDTTKALQLCISAAGTEEYCEGR